MLPEIEFTPQFARALRLMDSGTQSVFVTGKAGTGKSTLLRYFRAHTNKKAAVLAPTGVAAVNVGGETIHSFFRFGPAPSARDLPKLGREKSRLYKEIDALVIDEVSMARADLLDCVDAFLRLNGREPEAPFGGVQLILIGDLYQLPPVVTKAEEPLFSASYEGPYFFSAKAFEGLPLAFVELEKVYRQSDPRFIDLLNAVRANTVTAADLAALNRRVGAEHDSRRLLPVSLVTTNAAADRVNEQRLAELPGREQGYAAKVTGEFSADSYPAPKWLRLKPRAQVMLLNNDPAGRWVNGTMAEVAEVLKGRGGEPDSVLVRLADCGLQEVRPHEWDLFHYEIGEPDGRLAATTAGTFAQYPLKLAWGLTIHKSQGKTFDRLTLDLGDRAFATGQTYVGLSRCVSLEGLSLARPVRRGDLLVDRRVTAFMERMRRENPPEAAPREEAYEPGCDF